ncbi:MAG TPA: DUF2254 domain-containing protein [Acidobacteriaceae bacterium]|nr:DUF2254 domain-containing protein [Acidobacteriaceae bacterium]
MARNLPSILRRAMYNLRGGFLVRPLTIAIALGAAGGLLSWIEEEFPRAGAWVPAILFPSHSDPQVAQVILGGIAASMMTVVSIVFAILLMSLTLASMQFSPRIIVSFSRDKATQWTLGIFLGTFCYCVAALPAARSVPHPFAPVATVLGAMLLALMCVGWLLFFIHHISQAISVNYIVDRIAGETEAVIDDVMPQRHHPDAFLREERPATMPEEVPLLSEESGYIRFIDVHRLASLAKQYHVRIRALRRVGHFVPEGVPLMMVSKGARLSPGEAANLVKAFDLGPARTLQQDVEFGVLQIVDIALKAISPAVNDPTTAIGCVDQLSRIMIRFAARQVPEEMLYDPPGVIRVSVAWMRFPRLLDAAFEQIRMYAKSDLAVSLRLLRALTDIATSTEDPAYRRILVERGARTVAGCAEKLGEDEMTELRVRLEALEELEPGTRAPGSALESQGS